MKLKYRWKLFISISLLMLTLILSSFVLSSYLDSKRIILLQEKQILNVATEIVQDIYAQNGIKGLRRWLHQLRERYHINIYLVTKGKSKVASLLLPAAVQKVSQRISLDSFPLQAFSYDDLFVSKQFMIGENIPARLIIYFPNKAEQGLRYFVVNNWLVILLLMVTVIILSYFLARIFSSPISDIKHTVCTVEGFDKPIHFSHNLLNRQDELGTLSRRIAKVFNTLPEVAVAQQRLMQDVSHELRSPLARLQVALEIARRRTGGTAEIELDRIALECDRLNELVGEILSLARLQAKTAINKAKFNLNTLLNTIVQDTNFEFAQIGTSVRLIADQEFFVFGDENLMRSAIENMTRNALRYTSAEKGVIISLKSLDKLASMIEINIRDFGPGVPDGVLPSLFKPFYRVDTSRTETTGGYGLGLAIAKRAIELHEGVIWAENVNGGGLAVKIKLKVHLS